MRTMKKRLGSLLLALALLGTLALPASAANDAVGTTLRLVEHSGTVTVKNASGKAVSVRDEMRLYNGYTVETGAKSGASISLDGTKAVKLDGSSKAELKKTGKQLEVALVKGNLFFSVDSPLKSDESFTVRTSTMTTGIRGSFGWINPREVMLLHGHAFVTCTNPVTGGTRTTELTSGEGVRYEPETAAVADPALREIDFDKHAIENEDVPAVAREELAADPVKREQLTRDVPALDAEALAGSAAEKRAEEDAAEEKEQKEADAALAAQAEELAKRETDYVAFAGEEQPVTIGVPTGLTSYTVDSGESGGNNNPPPAPKYTVRFDANGGTGTMQSVTMKAGAYTLPACAFTGPEVGGANAQRWLFTKWSVGGTEYDPGDQITVSGDTTVTAQWGEPLNIYIVGPTGGAPTNGTVTADKAGNKAAAGSRVTLTIAPDTGYGLGALTIKDTGNNNVGYTYGGNETTASFTMPGSAVTVSATFTQLDFYVSVASGITNGTVTPSVSNTDPVHYGEEITLTVTPASGYELTTLTVTGATSGNVTVNGTGNTRTFNMPAENVTVTAVFSAARTVTFTPSPANGTVKVNGASTSPVSVGEGATVTVTVTPASGYELTALTYTPEGGSATAITKDANGAYTFTMPTENVTVAATFTQLPPLTVTPTTAGVTLTASDYEYDTTNGVLKIKSATAMTIANSAPATATTHHIVVAGGVSADLTLAGVNIDTSSLTDANACAALDIESQSTGYVTITLADGTTNTLKSGYQCAGLQKNGSNGTVGTLTIKGTGTLNATGNNGAGIGGGYGRNTANITIESGTVNASVGSNGNSAGIGGGSGGSATNICIIGGSVTATGSNNGGAGIGGGNGGAGDVTISGDTIVTAIGGSQAAGIGGGNQGKGTVTISGGTIVEATGGNSGAGIGGGYQGEGKVTITAGTVQLAKGGECGAGIGGGQSGSATVEIKGSATVTATGGSITSAGWHGGAGIGGGGGQDGTAPSSVSVTIGDAVIVSSTSGTVTAGARKPYSATDNNYSVAGGPTVTATGGTGGTNNADNIGW